MQEFLIHLVIVVLMSGVLLFWAIPFIALAVVFFRKSARWLGEGARLAIACGIAAAGIAPHFDMYRQPHPIWLRWWDGVDVSIGYALVSFVVTWAVVYGQMRLLRRHHATPAAV
jgi:hypothetical protein